MYLSEEAWLIAVLEGKLAMDIAERGLETGFAGWAGWAEGGAWPCFLAPILAPIYR